MLFWYVFMVLATSELLPNDRAVPPLKIPNNVVVALLPVIVQFLIVLLLALSAAEGVESQITADDVPVFVLVMAMLRALPVPPFEPSIVTRSAPFSLIRALAEEPVM